ncbi:nuclear transport factor 2 family protein [Rhodanobacter koreensis]
MTKPIDPPSPDRLHRAALSRRDLQKRMGTTVRLGRTARPLRLAAVCLATAFITGNTICSYAGTAAHTVEANNTLTTEGNATSTTEANKAFVHKLFSENKGLLDFPDHLDPNLVIYEPASLPFGGTYRGLAEVRSIFPRAGKFYDFSRFEVLGIYGDGNTVFSSLKVGLAGSKSSIFIAEQWTFNGTKVVAIRVYVCEPQERAAHP